MSLNKLLCIHCNWSNYSSNYQFVWYSKEVVMCKMYFVMWKMYFVMCKKVQYSVMCTMYFVTYKINFYMCTICFVMCTEYFVMCIIYFVMRKMYFVMCKIFLFIVTPIVGVCSCSMFCCTRTLLYVHSSFSIILMGKRELVALLSLSSWCIVLVVWLFLVMPWVCLRFVIVIVPDHTYLIY